MKEWINGLPADRQAAVSKIIDIITANLPHGFEARAVPGFIHFEVPLSLYPKGYHCTVNTPLPFISLANQKNFIAIYHMGIYASPTLLEWFQNEYPKHAKYKLDMGKSCIRLKKMDDIPFELIGLLATKMTAQGWIDLYEKNYVK